MSEPELYKTACILKPNGTHKKTVIFLHGLGDQGESFVDVFDMLALKDTKVVLPNAPKRAITCNGGYKMPGWYDIYQLGPGRGLTQKEDEEGINDSLAKISAAIDYEIANGIKPADIVIGGFSQGSAMTQLVAARYPRTLGGVVALSGYALLSEYETNKFTKEGTQTPFFVYHGVADEVVPCTLARQSKDYYVNKGIASFKYAEEPGLGHSLSNKELVAVKAFFIEVGF